MAVAQSKPDHFFLPGVEPKRFVDLQVYIATVSKPVFVRGRPPTKSMVRVWKGIGGARMG
jgi:hypothetical protein